MKENFLKLFIAVFALGVFVTLHDGLALTTSMLAAPASQPGAISDPTPEPTGTPTVDLKVDGSDGPITVPVAKGLFFHWTSSAHISTCSIGQIGVREWSGNNRKPWMSSVGTHTFTIVCGDPIVMDSVTVNVVPSIDATSLPPSVDIKANGSDGPITLPNNSGVTLSWTSNYSDLECLGGYLLDNINGVNRLAPDIVPIKDTTDWDSYKSTASGNQTISHLTSPGVILFKISCSGHGGSASDAVIVNVQPDLAPVTVDLKVNGSDGPITVPYQGDLEISWSSTNTDADAKCSPGGGPTAVWDNYWSPRPLSPNGQLTYKNENSLDPKLSMAFRGGTFEFVCTDRGKTVSDKVVVNVTPKPLYVYELNLLADDKDREITVPRNTNVMLTWTSNYLSKSVLCDASGSWSGRKDQNGREFTGALTSNKVYTLKCSDINSYERTFKEDTVTIRVEAATAPTTPTTPTQPTTPTTPKTLTCDSTAKAVVTALGGCSNIDQTEYKNVYGACCTVVTKTTLLQILNDALADGVIDATEKKSLLSALNSYLSK